MQMGPSGNDVYRAEKSPSIYPYPSTLPPDDDLSMVEFNENLSAPLDTCSFDAYLYTSMDIQLILKQSTDIPHSQHDVNQTNSKELHDSFCSDGCQISPYVSLSKQCLCKQALQLLQPAGKERAKTSTASWLLGLSLGRARSLNVLRSPPESTNPANNCISDQLQRSYISKLYDRLLLMIVMIILSRQNTLSPPF